MLGIFIVFLLLGVSQSHAATTTVCGTGCDYSNLQTALDNAKPGDTLVLKAGETFTGNFVLPYKEGADYITIRSSRLAELPPPGYRVKPEHAIYMPKLIPQYRTAAVLRAGEEEIYTNGVDVMADRILFGGNHGLSENEPVACWADGPMPGGLEQNRVYYVRNMTPVNFQVALTPDGNGTVDITSPQNSQRFRCTRVRNGHHYRIQGIEFSNASGQTQEYNLIEIGTGQETARAGIPHHFELDRIYVHGTADSEGPRLCLGLNAADFSLTDSYISDCKKPGEEAKAIAAWQAPGPGLIRNNHIEGASINMLLGGEYVRVADLVNGDNGGLLIEGNLFTKQIQWKYSYGVGGAGNPSGACPEYSTYLNTVSGRTFYCRGGVWTLRPVCAQGEYYRRTDVPQSCAGGACFSCGTTGSFSPSTVFRSTGYAVKNLFEAKSAIDTVIRGNVFENNWPNSDQSGVAVWLISQVPQGNADAWVRGENILFEKNIIRNSAQGIRFASQGNVTFGRANRNVAARNNLLYDIGATATPTLTSDDARPISFGGRCDQCSFENNTVYSGIPTGMGVMYDTGVMTGFRFANNIAHYNGYGILGDIVGGECLAINYYMTAGSVFTNNVLIHSGVSVPTNIGSCTQNSKYVPPSVPLFTNPGTKNFRLNSTSPYSAFCKNGCDFKATNTKDLGADIDEVLEATSGAASGTPNWATLAGLRVDSIGSDRAVLWYRVPSEVACTLRASTDFNLTSVIPDVDPLIEFGRDMDTRTSNVAESGERFFVLGQLVPLMPETKYYLRLTCGERVMSTELKTRPAIDDDSGNIQMQLRPAPNLNATQAVIDYGPTKALGTTTPPVACAAGCLVEIPMTMHGATYYRYRYLNSAQVPIQNGPIRVKVRP